MHNVGWASADDLIVGQEFQRDGSRGQCSDLFMCSKNQQGRSDCNHDVFILNCTTKFYWFWQNGTAERNFCLDIQIEIPMSSKFIYNAYNTDKLIR